MKPCGMRHCVAPLPCRASTLRGQLPCLGGAPAITANISKSRVSFVGVLLFGEASLPQKKCGSKRQVLFTYSFLLLCCFTKAPPFFQVLKHLEKHNSPIFCSERDRRTLGSTPAAWKTSQNFWRAARSALTVEGHEALPLGKLHWIWEGRYHFNQYPKFAQSSRVQILHHKNLKLLRLHVSLGARGRVRVFSSP